MRCQRQTDYGNPSTPVAALERLVGDSDDWVRWWAASNPNIVLESLPHKSTAHWSPLTCFMSAIERGLLPSRPLPESNRNHLGENFRAA